MRRLSPLLLVAAALAFAACGGSDNKSSNASNSTGTTQSTTTQSTTGTTPQNSGTTGQQSGKRKSNGIKGGGTTKTQTQTQTQAKTQTRTQAPAKTGTTPAPTVASPFKTSRTVCGAFLPIIIQHQLKRHTKSKKTVARQYAKGYPKEQRNQAYRGCLAGLKNYK